MFHKPQLSRLHILLSVFLASAFTSMFVTHSVHAFEKGDSVYTTYVCRSESLVTKIAEVDASNTEEAFKILQESFRLGFCMQSRQVLKVFVKDVILEYKDSEGKEVQLLELINTEDSQGQRYFIFLYKGSKNAT